MEELLTVEEAAAYLRVSRATLWRWCKARRVPAFKIGREWRVRKQALQQVAASGFTMADTGEPHSEA